ncbi:MAG: TRAP transporter small permease [Kiloniellales bacterium]|nr:TRAP transporter small permease [Kiloniellales bacterium]
MKTVLESVCCLSTYVAVILMAAMAGFVVLSSVMRYAIGAPFHFTEELVGLLFCSMVFLVLPGVQFRNQHIKVDLLTSRFGARATRIQRLSALALTIAFGVAFGWEAYDYLVYAYERGSVTYIGDIPLFPWVGVIVFAVSWATLVALWQVIRSMRRADRFEATDSPK